MFANMQTLPEKVREESCCSGLEKLLSPGFFKALGDPHRIALFVWLANRCSPATVSEIGACCPVHLSVVSRHLAMLREAGLVTSERRGREVLYRVNYGILVDNLRQMADAIENCCVVPGRGSEITTTVEEILDE